MCAIHFVTVRRGHGEQYMDSSWLVLNSAQRRADDLRASMTRAALEHGTGKTWNVWVSTGTIEDGQVSPAKVKA